MIKKKKIIYDSILNIIGLTIPIVVLQLFILPLVASKMGEALYGKIIAIVSFTTAVSVPFGNVLNNIRLLENENYRDKDPNGDFNILLILSSIVNCLIVILAGIYFKENLFGILLIIVISISGLLKEYFVVEFRLQLNYVKIIINNLLLAIGYISGFILFNITGYWQFIYFLGHLFSLFYLLKVSQIFTTSIRKTLFFKSTLKKSYLLFSSVFIKNIMDYGDKIILFPLLGPSAVSIYYSASLVGKMIQMLINPISSVVLSYLVRIKEFSKRYFYVFIILNTIIFIFGYIAIQLFSKPLLVFIYPNWYQDSLKLIPITGATAMVQLVIALFHPVILRFRTINWQVWLNIITLALYLLLSTIFYNYFGLLGYALGILIAYAIKLLLMILVLFISK